ncbi:MAG: metallophosphoesterase [bacterium]
MKISVATDLHFYNKSMGVNSPYFFSWTQSEIKMLAYSDVILDAFIDAINKQNPDVLILCGDLTNNGAEISHSALVVKLSAINPNIRIFVIPGNHDIGSETNFIFPDDGEPVKIESITKEQFRTIYSNFGYTNAEANAPDSLSYSINLNDQIKLIAIDSNNYNNRFPGINPDTGAISAVTLNWIKEQAEKAKSENRRIIAFMHHPLIEHFPMLKLLFPDFILHQSQNILKTFAYLGINIVLTGHHHANSIVSQVRGGSRVFDIQTSALTSYPIAYRTLDLEDSKIKINSNYLKIDINVNGQLFEKYAYDFTRESIKQNIIKFSYAYAEHKITDEHIEVLTETYMAYFTGNKIVTPRITQFLTENKNSDDYIIKPMVRFVKSIMITSGNTDSYTIGFRV